MNTIARQLLYTTVRIECFLATGEQSSGTVFCFSKSVKDVQYLFLVTNKHVIDGATSGRLVFTKAANGAPLVGEAYSLMIDRGFAQVWTGHPSSEIDIAIMPLVPILEHIKATDGVEVFIKPIGAELMPNDKQTELLDAIEEVIFVGYPNGLWDHRNLTPIVRRGITASPIWLDFDGTPTFLVDASVFPGSSGSPVFVYSNGTYRDSQTSFTIGERIFFVGVIAAVYQSRSWEELQTVTSTRTLRQGVTIQQPIDLGIVYKATAVEATVNHFLETHSLAVE